MQRLLTILLPWMLFGLSICAQSISTAELLVRMKETDQDARRAMVASKDSIEQSQNVARVARLDSLHGTHLHDILDTLDLQLTLDSIPGTVHDFWLLSMHQDGDVGLQNEVLERLEHLSGRPDFLRRDIAYLRDRIAVNEGRCQTYGTQTWSSCRKNKRKVFPICNRKAVRQLRKDMALMPLRRQLKQEQAGL